jgi:hypothetical protein
MLTAPAIVDFDRNAERALRYRINSSLSNCSRFTLGRRCFNHLPHRSSSPRLDVKLPAANPRVSHSLIYPSTSPSHLLIAVPS